MIGHMQLSTGNCPMTDRYREHCTSGRDSEGSGAWEISSVAGSGDRFVNDSILSNDGV